VKYSTFLRITSEQKKVESTKNVVLQFYRFLGKRGVKKHENKLLKIQKKIIPKTQWRGSEFFFTGSGSLSLKFLLDIKFSIFDRLNYITKLFVYIRNTLLFLGNLAIY